MRSANAAAVKSTQPACVRVGASCAVSREQSTAARRHAASHRMPASTARGRGAERVEERGVRPTGLDPPGMTPCGLLARRRVATAQRCQAPSTPRSAAPAAAPQAKRESCCSALSGAPGGDASGSARHAARQRSPPHRRAQEEAHVALRTLVPRGPSPRGHHLLRRPGIVRFARPVRSRPHGELHGAHGLAAERCAPRLARRSRQVISVHRPASPGAAGAARRRRSFAGATPSSQPRRGTPLAGRRGARAGLPD